MRAVDQLLRRLTANSITNKEENLDLHGLNPLYVADLRERGFIESDKDVLAPKSLLLYFERYPVINCPPEVQKWVNQLCIVPPVWRRPGELIRIEHGNALAYAELNTIFVIPEEADLVTYWHELGHILFLRIPSYQAVQLAAEARAAYPVVSADKISDALDRFGRPTRLPDGMYIHIESRYCGIDHSGKEEEAQNNEIWANIFSAYCAGVALPPQLRKITDSIVIDLKSKDPYHEKADVFRCKMI